MTRSTDLVEVTRAVQACMARHGFRGARVEAFASAQAARSRLVDLSLYLSPAEAAFVRAVGRRRTARKPKKHRS